MITDRKDECVFTARNRQNPFANRRRKQSEEPKAAHFDSDKSTEHTETPDIAKLATGGLVESVQNRDSMPERTQTGFDLVAPEQREPEVPVVAVTPISADTQEKIDAIVNRAVPPVAADTDEPKRGRGRPRPTETIVRDGKVFDLLKAADEDEGVSKEALAISLDEKEQQVYSSLRQLKKEGRAETRYVKGSGYRWFAVSPAETL